ncbi:hypothetical protein WMY93_032779 [Mugilogobius chulae]|uniref:Uncharacterized protein n=1 Tax=Mugilogobius chulae TaxID=88201 RepID=A0AAW0MMN5_9GOBI
MFSDSLLIGRSVPGAVVIILRRWESAVVLVAALSRSGAGAKLISVESAATWSHRTQDLSLVLTVHPAGFGFTSVKWDMNSSSGRLCSGGRGTDDRATSAVEEQRLYSEFILVYKREREREGGGGEGERERKGEREEEREECVRGEGGGRERECVRGEREEEGEGESRRERGEREERERQRREVGRTTRERARQTRREEVCGNGRRRKRGIEGVEMRVGGGE